MARHCRPLGPSGPPINTSAANVIATARRNDPDLQTSLPQTTTQLDVLKPVSVLGIKTLTASNHQTRSAERLNRFGLPQ